MRKILSYTVALFPVAAIALLILASAASSRRAVPQDQSDPYSTRASAPLQAATFVRRHAMQADYENLCYWRVRAAAQRSPALRATFQHNARESRQRYNAVAARADDSDFAAVPLPRHLDTTRP